MGDVIGALNAALADEFHFASRPKAQDGFACKMDDGIESMHIGRGIGEEGAHVGGRGAGEANDLVAEVLQALREWGAD